VALLCRTKGKTLEEIEQGWLRPEVVPLVDDAIGQLSF